jgi:hypothetical protein
MAPRSPSVTIMPCRPKVRIRLAGVHLPAIHGAGAGLGVGVPAEQVFQLVLVDLEHIGQMQRLEGDAFGDLPSRTFRSR